MSIQLRRHRMDRTEPHYQRLKRHIVDGIANGIWLARDRIPSEGELTRSFGLSRMTVNRALRELAAEGVIVREQGRGSFVAPAKAEATMVAVRNIRLEIEARGALYEARQVHLGARWANEELAHSFEVAEGTRLFVSRLVHLADGVALQLEHRIVNPAIAPRYLEQDFAIITPHQYLMQVAPLERTEHSIEADLPDAETLHLLSMRRGTPVLILTRRTFSQGRVASIARLLHPADRYRFTGQFDGQGRTLDAQMQSANEAASLVTIG
jgi:GntR family histidine utilization transcriptional repressor